MAKRAKKTLSGKSAESHKKGKPARATTKAEVAKLLPPQGEVAEQERAALRALMVMSGLTGGLKESKRPILVPTAIRELHGFYMSKEEVACLQATLVAEGENFPAGGVALRYRIEIAALLLSMLIHYAYGSYEEHKAIKPQVLAEVALELAVVRARELWSESDE